MKTLVIAEAGVNHNGDMDLAFQLVDAAAAAGADLVKFQTFVADRLVTAQAPKAAYQKASGGSDESQHAMLKRLELDRAAHERLIAHCERTGIGFFSTGFDAPSLQMLNDLGLRLFKVPSGELTNLPYLRQIASYGRPVILSTGMATMEEVAGAIDALRTAGVRREDLTVLHCTTEYPTPMEDVNLRAMLEIRDRFGVAVGYSDHTKGIEVPIAAVALGASVIEKHFTMDRTLPGPDHEASLEPEELHTMVAAIRNIEQAIGDGVKRPAQGELANRAAARKSIVASRAIRAGETLDAASLTAKRPGTGISPMLWDEVVGTVARRDFAADEMIEL